MTTLIALLLFPCLAIVWLMVCDQLGWVRDEPLIDDRNEKPDARVGPAEYRSTGKRDRSAQPRLRLDDPEQAGRSAKRHPIGGVGP